MFVVGSGVFNEEASVNDSVAALRAALDHAAATSTRHVTA